MKRVQLSSLRPGDKFRFHHPGRDVVFGGFTNPEVKFTEDGHFHTTNGGQWPADRKVYVEEPTYVITIPEEVKNLADIILAYPLNYSPMSKRLARAIHAGLPAEEDPCTK